MSKLHGSALAIIMVLLIAVLTFPIQISADIIKTITPINEVDLMGLAVCSSSILDGNYIYSTYWGDHTITKVNKTTYVVEATNTIYDAGLNEGIGGLGLVMSGGYLWTSDYYKMPILYKIDPSDLSLVSKIDLGWERYATVSALVGDGTNIYVGSWFQPANIWTYEKNYTSTTGVACYGARYEYQSFTPDITHTIEDIWILGYRFGTIGNLTCNVYLADGAHKPDVASGVKATGTYDASALTTSSSGATVKISLGAGYTLTAGVEYTFVLSIAGDINNYFGVRYANSDTYANGTMGYSTNSGINWTVQAFDMYFCEGKEYGPGVNFSRVKISDSSVTSILDNSIAWLQIASMCEDSSNYVYGRDASLAAFKLKKNDLTLTTVVADATYNKISQDSTYFYNNQVDLYRTKKSDLSISTLVLPDQIGELDANTFLSDGRLLIGNLNLVYPSNIQLYIVNSDFTYNHGVSFPSRISDWEDTNNIIADGTYFHVVTSDGVDTRMYEFLVSDLDLASPDRKSVV